jgi:hypothetical protein
MRDVRAFFAREQAAAPEPVRPAPALSREEKAP